MSYMAKKTQKRQSAIVSLSDRNANEIQQINNHKTKMLKDYEETKSGIMSDNIFSVMYFLSCIFCHFCLLKKI